MAVDHIKGSTVSIHIGWDWMSTFHAVEWKDLDKDADTAANSHDAQLSRLSTYYSTWINQHLGTSEKLDFISFLVLYHHESFVNLNPLTYIIIFSFKVDFQHQRDYSFWSTMGLDHCLTHSLRFCHNDIRRVMWIKRLENSSCLCSLSNFNQNVMLCHFPWMWNWQVC